jgi:hypothetical protein
MFETARAALYRDGGRNSVYRVSRDFCSFDLCKTLKRRAVGSSKLYAALQYDEISGHSLHKRCVIAQAECRSESFPIYEAYNFSGAELLK